MIVISDSTPLITLMKATQLEILQKLFSEIIIPEAVYLELTANINYADEADQINKSTYIKVVTVDDKRTVSVLQRATGLDLGESEAIIYADINHADLLLVDEVAGRRVAMDMGINIMGSIGVLISAYKEGLINMNEAEEALKKIRNANRHISEKLLSDVLDIIREN